MNKPLDTSKPVRDDDNSGKAYGYKVCSGMLTKGDGSKMRRYTERQFEDGDIIEMILDLNKKQLSFTCNAEDYGVAFDNIEDTSYRGCVSFYDCDYSIELLEYTQVDADEATEHFDPSNTSNAYKLLLNNTILTRKSNGNHACAYLSQIARNGVHRWKFKLKVNSTFSMTIVFGN